MIYTRKVFKNGLRLVTITGLSTNAVTITAYIRGGIRFDPQNRAGLSHFTEHIIFNATKSSSKFSTLAQAVERCGGWRSAFTWIEYQEHMVHLSKDNFEDGVKLTLGTIFEPFITKTEIEKEKGVVREEILRNKADPSKAIWDYAWFPLFFQGTNLARPYSGTANDISMISESDVKSFASNYFQTENSVIFVAGNLESSYIQEIVDQYSKEYKGNYKKESMVNLAPKIKKHVFVHVDHSYYQTSLAIGIQTVPFNSSLKYPFDILREMLAGYFGAPLIQRLRDEGGLIYTWDSFQDNLSDIGYLLFNVSVAHENVNRVASIILQEFKRFANGKFTNDEVKMAKSHLIGSILANIETGQDYIRWYGLQELLNPKQVLGIEDKIALYKKISIEQIKKAAGKYFSSDNIFIGAIGKVSDSSLSSLL